MRVCLITPEFPPRIVGGIGSYVRDLAEQLSLLGAQITVCGVGIHATGSISHPWGCSISLPLPRQSRANKATERFRSKLESWPVVWRIAHHAKGVLKFKHQLAISRLLDRFVAQRCDEFDIVEIPNWLGQGALLRPLKAKLFVRLSSPAVECASASGRLTALEAATCNNALRIIGNSNAILEKVTGLYKLDLSKVVIIPHGVADVAVPQVSRRSDGIDVLMVGRSERRKGTDILLKALPKVLEEFPSLRVSFLGPDDEYLLAPFPELVDTWRRLLKHFPNQLRCLGRVSDEDKYSYYAASHWVAIPSRFESFGLVAIEALRAGTPFIAAASGGLVETAKACPVARLVNPNEPMQWEAALRALARHGPEFAESLREPCRTNFEENFTIKRVASETLQLYARVL